MPTVDSNRIVRHIHNPDKSNNTSQVLLKITDDIYTKKNDYEALDAEVVPRGIRKVYRITCIPFLTYDINKGDVVTIKDGVISKKLVDGGQYGYRILYPDFGSDSAAHKYIDPVLSQLKTEGFEVEEYNHKLSAVNAINRDEAIRLEKIFKQMINQGNITAYDTVR